MVFLKEYFEKVNFEEMGGFAEYTYPQFQLEDLKVLRRSPDLLTNVKIGQDQLQLIMEQVLFYHIWGLQTFGQVT